MKNVAPKAIGDPNQLDDLVSTALNAAMATEDGEVFAFGNPWPRSASLTGISIFGPARAYMTCT
jgi:hypothetical protein